MCSRPHGTVVGGQDYGANLMGAQDRPEGVPRGVDALVKQRLLNGHQDMVGHQGQEDVGVGPALDLMVYGPHT